MNISFMQMRFDMRCISINKIIFFIVLIFLTKTSLAQAGWVIFSKPAYEGELIDSETREPIEGALVIVYYNKLWLSPAGNIGDTFDAKETLTDNNGKFRFSPYLTVINPLCIVGNTYFTIAKPGYFTIEKANLHDQLSGLSNDTKELYYSDPEDRNIKIIIKVIKHQIILQKIHKSKKHNRLFGAPLQKFYGAPNWEKFPISKKIYDEEYNMVKKSHELEWHKERLEKVRREMSDLIKNYNSLYEQLNNKKQEGGLRLQLQYTANKIKILLSDYNTSEIYIAKEEGREPNKLDLDVIRPVPDISGT